MVPALFVKFDGLIGIEPGDAELTADPSFGLNAGRTVGPGSFNVVSYILLSSATLRAGLGVLQQYQRLISDGGRFQILAGERQSWVVYHPQQGSLAFSPHQVEAVLAATVSFSRWVTGRALRPARAQFSHWRRSLYWDALDFAYFSGYAMWNYLSLPFLLRRQLAEHWPVLRQRWRIQGELSDSAVYGLLANDEAAATLPV